jgi:hypothetical protein
MTTMTQDLKTLRDDLLRLHGALLAAEREAHERVYGRVAPGEMLRLLLNDENFQWLRPISGLVADIDGALADDRKGERPLDAGATAALVRRARAVVEPDAATAERYQAWLQDAPDVLLAHRAVAGRVRQAVHAEPTTSSPSLVN